MDREQWERLNREGRRRKTLLGLVVGIITIALAWAFFEGGDCDPDTGECDESDMF